jgi:hypothetical protein
LGDADCNGQVNSVDLLYVKKHLLQMSTLSGQGFTNCDLDGSGEITANELLTLKKYLLQMVSSLG